MDPLELAAIEMGITEGRGGKGAIYVFAAGNEGEGNIDVNMMGYTNSRYGITVGAVNQDGTKCEYSNTGASLLVVAPSGGDTTYDDDDVLVSATVSTTTTDRTGEDGYNNYESDEELQALIPDYEDLNYTNTFNGTSAATPVVSGVVALMLQANPNLTWRDVQQILVDTSVQVDVNNEDWVTNGAGRKVSYNYGFGLVNAEAAVKAALTLKNLPEELHCVGVSADSSMTIGAQCESIINISDKSIGALETVEVTVNITHPTEGDLRIELISPDGTVSVLAQERRVRYSDGGYDNYTFTTKRCWGEQAVGDWTLRITDTGRLKTGVLNDWTINLYGNRGEEAHVGPDIVSVFPDADSSLLENPSLDYAPNELTIRFTEGQEIDPNTLDAVKLMYRQNEASEWEEVEMGWVGIGAQANEVIVRPASTFLDGLYELVIVGTGDNPLLNSKGFEFRYDAEKGVGSDYTFDFAMTLPLQVTAVVPMPVVNGEVKADQIEVYFNADKTDNTYYTEPQYYTLFATQDTASSIDDYHVNPKSVELDTVIDGAGHTVMRATLTFSDDINKIFGVYGSYRLKVGEVYNYSDTEEFADVDGEDFEAGDAFRTSKDVSGYFATTNDVYSSLVINGNIDVKKANEAIQAMIGGGMSMAEIEALQEQVYDYDNRWPGGNDEPGHEMRTTSLQSTANVEQHISSWDFEIYDAEPGVVTYFYCFPKKSGSYNNYVTEQQKNSVRQIFQLLGDSCGIQFFELKTPDDGTTVDSVNYKGTDFPVISFYVADLALMGGDSGPGGVAGLGGGTKACLDLADFGNTNDCEYGSGFYSVAMHEIMHCLSQGHTYDLDGATIMGSSTKEFYTGSEESVFPAPADIVHLQYMFRNDSIDVDMYSFTLKQSGTLELETIARRLEMSSSLDTVLNLYDENGTLIATNDNYFGLDSLIEVSLKPGKYYVGVSSAGNEDYDPVNIKTGMNGTTEGEYQLKLSFTPAQNSTKLLNFDGDMDGKVGGDFNFWFDVQKDENILYVDKTGEFTPDNGTSVYTQIDEAIADAAAMVEQFKQAGSSDRVVVRILANNTDKTDLTQRQAYEIGTYKQGGSTTILEDGATLDIPKGVSVVVEQGAVIKLANTNITAGSLTAIGPVNNVLDQTPAGTIQLLGAPNEKVYLTSYWDETIGSDSYTQTTTPKSGDWGGIVLTNVKEHEYNNSETAKTYGKVTILEDEGVFINYIGFTDISYGGGEVNVNGFRSVYAPVYLDEARPTILSNTITSSMTAAISADPNSFEESHIYGVDEYGDWYTADYDRVGPTIHNNTLVKTHVVKTINKATGEVGSEVVTSSNSVNGLAIRTTTPSQSTINKLDVPARFDDWDITHVIQEDLILASAAGGPEVYLDPRGNTSVNSRVGGSLRIDDNVLIKLGNSRIELEDNANLIAEGDKGDEIIFTSVYDDKYGYGGTFDATNNGFNADINPNAPEYNPENNDYLQGGNWGGIYLGHSSTASLDNIKLMYAGGQSRIEGYFVNFQPIEVVQADLRLTNSYFAYNSAATESSDRIGRGNVTNPAVIYVRNAQPIIVDNNFADNETAIISINANALTADTVTDKGRQTGLLIQQEEGAKYDNLYPEYSSNYGPMVRENEFNDNLFNGMVVRGEVLTTESIWDDVDIVHILQNEIVVGNHHTFSGLRLQSSTTGSLVVKLFGNNAGFTAAGAPNDVEDRIGGTVQVIGNALYPVILTSLYDNTVGAGYDQWGNSV
ncbi:MAG: proprotein convertase P-domain-containing protein, partial [Thermoguttaceae bacterium]|nr:proprotein convertase P-domain-containing protein [Thermoguttaceae bacterium]